MADNNANIHFKISESFKRNPELEHLLANKKGDEIIMTCEEYQCLKSSYDQYIKIANLGNWVEILKECQNSGKSIKTWCEEMGIPRHKYYYWRRKWKCFFSSNF